MERLAVTFAKRVTAHHSDGSSHATYSLSIDIPVMLMGEREPGGQARHHVARHGLHQGDEALHDLQRRSVQMVLALPNIVEIDARKEDVVGGHEVSIPEQARHATAGGQKRGGAFVLSRDVNTDVYAEVIHAHGGKHRK